MQRAYIPGRQLRMLNEPPKCANRLAAACTDDHRLVDFEIPNNDTLLHLKMLNSLEMFLPKRPNCFQTEKSKSKWERNLPQNDLDQNKLK